MLTDTSTIHLDSLNVSVQSDTPAVLTGISEIYSAAPTPPACGSPSEPDRASTIYCVKQDPESGFPWPTYMVFKDGIVWGEGYSQTGVLTSLEWAITDEGSRALTGYHLIHGGSVARNGHGVLLPAAAGSGKSTTVAALALNGFEYLSDELGLVGADGRLRPFPKIITLKAGGWKQVKFQFAQAVEAAGWPSVLVGDNICHVKPPSLPSEANAAAGYPLDFIVIPRYSPCCSTELQSISKSRALKELVEQSMDLELQGASGFRALVELAQRAECYYLMVNDLKQAAGLLRELTD